MSQLGNWKGLLKELQEAALNVPNCAAANEDVLSIKHLPAIHSVDHMEDINPVLHALFG